MGHGSSSRVAPFKAKRAERTGRQYIAREDGKRRQPAAIFVHRRWLPSPPMASFTANGFVFRWLIRLPPVDAFTANAVQYSINRCGF
jgi:hypothetical protein